MQSYIIEAREVDYTYPDGTIALHNLTMQIPQGLKIAVLGANGAGKSTLFLLFNGILRPQGGHIIFKGQTLDYRRRTLLELRKKVGLVFQNPDGQLFSASVLEDIAFGPLNLGLTPGEARARSQQAMVETEVVDLKDKPTHLLSYGQKKRVSIAGVLAMEPEIIILDEPTAGLDPGMAQKVIDILNKQNTLGKTIVISTHDVDLAYEWVDYTFLLAQGQIVGEGEPGQTFGRQELLARCSLKQPWVLKVYDQLMSSGILHPQAPVPRNKEELYQMIQSAGSA